MAAYKLHRKAVVEDEGNRDGRHRQQQQNHRCGSYLVDDHIYCKLREHSKESKDRTSGGEKDTAVPHTKQ